MTLTFSKSWSSPFDWIPYIAFIHFPHSSLSIQVNTTSRSLTVPLPSVLHRHFLANSRNWSRILSVLSLCEAAITTSGDCGAFITLWNVSWVSSRVVGRRCLRSHLLSLTCVTSAEPCNVDEGNWVSWSLWTVMDQSEPDGIGNWEWSSGEEEA